MRLPRYIYHGTTVRAAARAWAEGLKPRGTAAGGWENCPSHPEHVYLTRGYAGYYGQATRRGDDQDQEDPRFAIIRLDFRFVNKNRLYPDEDFIAQGLTKLGEAEEGDLLATTLAVRERLHDYQHVWRGSLEGLGNASHWGEISPHVIKDVAVIDASKAPYLCLRMVDPTITVLNYHLVGAEYRAITTIPFGVPVTRRVLYPPGSLAAMRLPLIGEEQVRLHVARIRAEQRDGCAVYRTAEALRAIVGQRAGLAKGA